MNHGLLVKQRDCINLERRKLGMHWAKDKVNTCHGWWSVYTWLWPKLIYLRLSPWLEERWKRPPALHGSWHKIVRWLIEIQSMAVHTSFLFLYLASQFRFPQAQKHLTFAECSNNCCTWVSRGEEKGTKRQRQKDAENKAPNSPDENAVPMSFYVLFNNGPSVANSLLFSIG